VLITCWSSKGGSGTTVVAAALAALLGAEGPTLLVDLGGDLPAALGLPEPAVGLTSWIPGGAAEPVTLAPGTRERATSGVGDPAELAGPGTHRSPERGTPILNGLREEADDLSGLEVGARAGVRLVPLGAGRLGDGIGPALARALAGRGSVVVDAGVVGSAGPALDLAAAATASLLVIRPCFLALRRAVAAPVRSSGVVVVDEPQRVLGASDIEAALGVPVVATVPWDPAVARLVDAGLLGSALPRGLARSLRRVVPRAPAAADRACTDVRGAPGAGGGRWLTLVPPHGPAGTDAGHVVPPEALRQAGDRRRRPPGSSRVDDGRMGGGGRSGGSGPEGAA